jgi:hypothetical protein
LPTGPGVCRGLVRFGRHSRGHGGPLNCGC